MKFIYSFQNQLFVTADYIILYLQVGTSITQLAGNKKEDMGGVEIKNKEGIGRTSEKHKMKALEI